MSDSQNIKFVKDLVKIATHSLYLTDKNVQISRRGSYDNFTHKQPSGIFT